MALNEHLHPMRRHKRLKNVQAVRSPSQRHGNVALNEHLCPVMRRHKRLKYMRAVRSSSQRIRRRQCGSNMRNFMLLLLLLLRPLLWLIAQAVAAMTDDTMLAQSFGYQLKAVLRY